MTIRNLTELNDAANEFVLKHRNPVTAKGLGLDSRCDGLFIVEDNEEMYLCTHVDDRGYLEYYGGFEYVAKEHVKVFGEWVFYSSEDNRVNGHIARLYQII